VNSKDIDIGELGCGVFELFSRTIYQPPPCKGETVAGEWNPPKGLAKNPPISAQKKLGRYFIVLASLLLTVLVCLIKYILALPQDNKCWCIQSYVRYLAKTESKYIIVQVFCLISAENYMGGGGGILCKKSCVLGPVF
jgi:hypothetical protein